MGYSKNIAVLERDRHLLAELELGHPCRWNVVKDWQATRRFADKIRQALSIGALYPEVYPTVAAAHRNFSIHTPSAGVIEARLKYEPTVAEPLVPSAPTGKTLASELISAWDAHLPFNDPIKFTHTILSTQELTKLYTWAKSRTPKLMILTGTGFVTLAVVEIGAAAFEWTPPEPVPEPEPLYDLE